MAGQLNISYNAAQHGAGLILAITLVSTDIPWLANASTVGGGNRLDVGAIVFDPIGSERAIATAGVGV